MLAVAVAFQNACEGAVMAAPLRHAGWSRAKPFGIAATGLATPLAAIGGYLAGTHATSMLPFALALASGALIYLISNVIIPETPQSRERGDGDARAGGGVRGDDRSRAQSLGHSH